ncbi:predicted protein [Aspergillus terreus NIH2624]|uniref:Alpha/beta hydrolase fold-3 domain-containing protein n=1 Tax=Aspergillus terreus (strain NIH 2624 / FGSC A1156) TaxID=341663 RepID=Q0CTY9_ASPTN|nr:uncharacterized protein ATEG_02845 [Aspergillus terreus NIH2624]EAU36119.1 predicted protein [Aspergillus terreus NIH2624]
MDPGKTTPIESTSNKLERFQVIQVYYKVVSQHGIRADILVPQTDFGGKRPAIIRLHGGGLVVKLPAKFTYIQRADKLQIQGDSLVPELFPRWLADLAYKHNAIIISGNYRLMPEATGLQILQDVEDLWTYIHSPTLASVLYSRPIPIELDLDRLIVAGDSAGGLLSAYLALSHPDNIRAGILAYPMLDVQSDAFSTPRERRITGLPFVPRSVLTEHCQNLETGDIVSSAPQPDRSKLTSAVFHYGMFSELYERESENSSRRGLLFPLDKLRETETKLPRGGICIFHCIDDDAVPVEGSRKFAEIARATMRGKQGGDKVVLTLLESGNHAFDFETDLDEPWLTNTLKHAVDTWLQ